MQMAITLSFQAVPIAPSTTLQRVQATFFVNGRNISAAVAHFAENSLVPRNWWSSNRLHLFPYDQEQTSSQQEMIYDLSIYDQVCDIQTVYVKAAW